MGAIRAASQARYRQPWGADANFLRNAHAVEAAAQAGFTCFTLDPTEFIRHGADALDAAEVAAAIHGLIEEGTLTEDWCQPYLDRTIELSGSQALTLTLEPLRRAAVRYGRAIRHCARLSEAVARANHGRPYEIEAFFGSSPELTTALEHLFIGLELEARGVRLTGLALKLVAPADAGNSEAAGVRLRQHAALAEFCGPYKLCFHDLSFLPSLHPLVGRCCGEALHVKSEGVTYLEALRVLERTEPRLLESIAQLLPHEGATLTALVGANAGSAEEDAGLLLGRSATALFSPARPESRSVKESVTATLGQHAEIYREQLATVFDKRLSLLNAG